MRGAIVAVLIVPVLASSASPAAGTRVIRGDGLRALAPTGWHTTAQILSDCADPTQALAVTNVGGPISTSKPLPPKAGVLLVLQDGVNSPTAFRGRRPFRLPAKAELMGGCCDTPFGSGYSFNFRDRGRDFDVFLYAADRRVAEQGLQILNSLQVSAG
jgi:hypothetical protein